MVNRASAVTCCDISINSEVCVSEQLTSGADSQLVAQLNIHEERKKRNKNRTKCPDAKEYQSVPPHLDDPLKFRFPCFESPDDPAVVPSEVLDGLNRTDEFV